MHRVASLPADLAAQYRAWARTTLADNRKAFETLAAEGQHPKSMVIACCDSRVTVEALFGPGPGEIFVHRNIANLVPVLREDGGNQGTPAAVEYAVGALGVSHLVVLGHSSCGGVRGCMDMCEGHAPDLEKPESHVGRWLDDLRPAHDHVTEIEDPDARAMAMEKAGIALSLRNLMSYPFVSSRVDAGTLRLHGLWVDIATGAMESYDGTAERFAPI